MKLDPVKSHSQFCGGDVSIISDTYPGLMPGSRPRMLLQDWVTTAASVSRWGPGDWTSKAEFRSH